MVYHPTPFVRPIVSTIYPHQVHPSKQKVTNDAGIAGSLAWHRDHNAHPPIVRHLTKRFIRIPFQQTRAEFEIGESLFNPAS
jgi:hypothetical protein